MAILRYAESAENDLLGAWLHIAADNPEAADQIIETIDREARLLLANPDMGRSRPELARGLRAWPTHTRYLLFYFSDAAGITIARVLHHARDVGAVAAWGDS